MAYTKKIKTTRIKKAGNPSHISFNEGETMYRFLNRQYTYIVGQVIESNNDVVIFDCGKVVNKLDIIYYAGVKFKSLPRYEKEVESTNMLGFKDESYLSEEEMIQGYVVPKYSELSIAEKEIWKTK